MSPRAACQLETIGFAEVYDYELGKADWAAAGLPLGGNSPTYRTVADALRPDVPTCQPHETIGDIRRRVEEAGWEDCLVIDCGDLVVGRLRKPVWDLPSSKTAAEVMQHGPTTVRPNGALDKLVQRMDRRPTPMVIVTTPQGSLLGAVLREDAKRLLDGESPQMIWTECAGCPGRWTPIPDRP